MATVTLAAQNVIESGLTPTRTSGLSISNTYQVANDGRVFLHFEKSGLGSCDVTVVTPGSVDGHAIADLVVTVPATTGDVLIGPFPPAVFNSGGMLSFTLGEITGLTVAVLRLP